ncbi:MAG: malto-oligosyltrehalose synthase, partial [bacterium]|nr:malto-oligosyltrehalose synthase [bacterium]
SIYDFLRSILLLEDPTDESREFVRKLQQVTGPVTAKAIEDTAFYVYNRLVSLNEVGGDPQRFGVSVEEFHRDNARRLADWPGSLNTTATHDTKRGEDVRLRIDALSEIPVEWEQRVQRWAQLATPFKTTEDGDVAPDANEELLVYQTLVGSFPDDGRVSDEYRARIGGYLEKALKEAKVHSSWTNPDEAYEKATRAFADALLSSRPFLDDFVPFVQRVAAAARVSSLAQVALKVASPGVPDVYQGCELWDLSLVDPDNRRPVDWAQRRKLLEAIAGRLSEGADSRLQLARELSQPATLVDGRAKLLLVREALRFRRAHGPLFLEGEYLPLAVEGPDAAHVVAFARRHGGERAVCVVPRLTLALVDHSGGKLALDAQVRIPEELRGAWTDVITGRAIGASETISVASLLADFPVALIAG